MSPQHAHTLSAQAGQRSLCCQCYAAAFNKQHPNDDVKSALVLVVNDATNVRSFIAQRKKRYVCQGWGVCVGKVVGRFLSFVLSRVGE